LRVKLLLPCRNSAHHELGGLVLVRPRARRHRRQISHRVARRGRAARRVLHQVYSLHRWLGGMLGGRERVVERGDVAVPVRARIPGDGLAGADGDAGTRIAAQAGRHDRRAVIARSPPPRSPRHIVGDMHELRPRMLRCHQVRDGHIRPRDNRRQPRRSTVSRLGWCNGLVNFGTQCSELGLEFCDVAEFECAFLFLVGVDCFLCGITDTRDELKRQARVAVGVSG